jgi:hypothetical protein
MILRRSAVLLPKLPKMHNLWETITRTIGKRHFNIHISDNGSTMR